MASSPAPSNDGAASQTEHGSIFQAVSKASSPQFATGPKLSVKLDDKNFLLWNQQVEGVVKMHKLHRLLVNPTIPQKYSTEEDRIADIVSDEFEKWIVQDQTLFTWLLSTLSESALTRVLTCHHSWQVWEKIQQHYFSHLKARVCQLRNELKNTKKGALSISEFLSKIHSIADALTSTGEVIIDSYLTDVILDGLPEDYNPFVMMIFGRSDTPTVSQIESLLLVQESQLDKYRQELAVANVSANLVQASNHVAQGTQGARGNASRGRGRQGRGRGRARGNPSTGTRPTCQLCGRYGHSVLE